MKLRRRADQKLTGYVGDHADKLSRIPTLPHDEDERPRREERDYGQTIFSRPPVPLPRFFRGGRKGQGG
jgi:hypothetical protein